MDGAITTRPHFLRADLSIAPSSTNLEISHGTHNFFLPIMAGKLTGNLTHLTDQTNVGTHTQLHFSPKVLVTLIMLARSSVDENN